MKILYVEDNPHQRESIKGLLEASGYNVVVAKDGIEGIEKAKEELPDIIIMDLRMPNLGGVDAIKHLKSDPAVSNIPVIVLSGWDRRRYREESLQAGAAKFLGKPVDIKKLIEEINDIMSSEDV